MVKPFGHYFKNMEPIALKSTAGFHLETTRHINFTYGITMTGSQAVPLIDSFMCRSRVN